MSINQNDHVFIVIQDDWECNTVAGVFPSLHTAKLHVEGKPETDDHHIEEWSLAGARIRSWCPRLNGEWLVVTS